MSEPEKTFAAALKKNWYLMIPSVVLIVLGFFLGSWPRDLFDANRNEGVTDMVQLPPGSPAAEAADRNFVKRPVGAGRSLREGMEEERRYLAQLETLKPEDEEYPLTFFRLGNVYYSVLREYEKAVPYFQEIVDNFPEHQRADTALRFLADCYVKSGNRSAEIALYEELMEKHPWESELHKWAERQLRNMPPQ